MFCPLYRVVVLSLFLEQQLRFACNSHCTDGLLGNNLFLVYDDLDFHTGSYP
jgi:hypothetical protein